MKELNTLVSTTREAGERRKTTRMITTITMIMTMIIVLAISNTLHTNSLRSNALQIRRSYITSLATMYTAEARY
jgi:hypothetical protein